MPRAVRCRQATIFFDFKRNERRGVRAVRAPSVRVAIIRFIEISDAPVPALAQCANPLKLAKQQGVVFRKLRLIDLIERHPAEQQTCVAAPVGRSFT
jgi:hypothetical protein